MYFQNDDRPKFPFFYFFFFSLLRQREKGEKQQYENVCIPLQHTAAVRKGKRDNCTLHPLELHLPFPIAIHFTLIDNFAF